MAMSQCDHYWLVRRGGKCPHCGVVFPGQFKPPLLEVAELIAKTPAPKMKPTAENVVKVKKLLTTLGYRDSVTDAQAMEIGQVILAVRHDMRDQPANGETIQEFYTQVRKFLDAVPWTQRSAP